METGVCARLARRLEACAPTSRVALINSISAGDREPAICNAAPWSPEKIKNDQIMKGVFRLDTGGGGLQV